MPQIRVMIETARVKDAAARNEFRMKEIPKKRFRLAAAYLWALPTALER